MKRWYNTKIAYASEFEQAMDQALVPLEHMSAYSPQLTKANTHRHRLVETVQDSYPDVPPDRDCRRAIFKPKEQAYYAAGTSLESSDLYIDFISAHLPGYGSEVVKDRRLDPNNPNALSRAESRVDNTDLVNYLESCEPGQTKLPNPFHERARIAKENADKTTNVAAGLTSNKQKRKSSEAAGGTPTKKSAGPKTLGLSSIFPVNSVPRVLIPGNSATGPVLNPSRASGMSRGRPAILGQSPPLSRDSSRPRTSSPHNPLQAPARQMGGGMQPQVDQGGLRREDFDWSDIGQRMAYVRQQSGKGKPGGAGN
ncbi:hypothetical protein IQ06DRAFT_295739 [Phaeosphaeriaceae sp. SRC1lsM3a]|nr:hypothetical protein IQ06DRAFT_295739 [Stagonospora sp. SRC1lsM3a]